MSDRRDKRNRGQRDQEGEPMEAEEEKFELDDDNDEMQLESEGEGDDLMENMEQDYEQIPELDQYENMGIDDQEDYNSIDEEARFRAEEEIEQRQRQNLNYLNRRAQAFDDELFDDDGDLQTTLLRRQRALQFGFDEEEQDVNEPDDEKYLDSSEPRGKLHIWIKEPRTVRWIAKTFKKFLGSFRDENNKPLYLNKIQEMCEQNKQSIEVSYKDIVEKVVTLGIWIAEEPAIILPYLNSIFYDIVITQYPQYEQIHPETFIRISELFMTENLRDLRQKHLNKLIKIRGVVTRRTAVFSQLKKVYYFCKCGDRKGPVYQNNNQEVKLGACAVCQSNGPFFIDSQNTIYRNYQKIKVQETPGSIPPGRVPRHTEVILLGDNIDVARPGDEVEVTGIYSHRQMG